MEREQREIAHFAEPRGGNDDFIVVILNFEFPLLLPDISQSHHQLGIIYILLRDELHQL